MKNVLQVIGISLLGILFSACKVTIEVPKGGHVITESGAITCRAGEVCEIDIVDIFFDETFIAIPHRDMYFNGWKKRQRGLAGGSYEPVTLQTGFFAGDDALMALLESDEVFYLTPTFSSECTNECDKPTLKLLLDDAFSIFPGEPKELSWPYSLTSSVTAQVTGIPSPTTYTVGRYSLQASGSDFTITNLQASDNSSVVTPFFKGITNQMVIRDGETVELELVSQLTRGRIAQLVYKFSIAETGGTFKSYVTLQTN